MAQTVAEVLTAATDSVTLIEDINTNGSSSRHVQAGATQAEINEMVQRDVDHISTILVYAPVDADDDTPDVAGSSENKTSYTAAVTTGNAYIAANS
jgi:hypothetical protein